MPSRSTLTIISLLSLCAVIGMTATILAPDAAVSLLGPAGLLVCLPLLAAALRAFAVIFDRVDQVA